MLKWLRKVCCTVGLANWIAKFCSTKIVSMREFAHSGSQDETKALRGFGIRRGDSAHLTNFRRRVVKRVFIGVWFLCWGPLFMETTTCCELRTLDREAGGHSKD